MKYVILILMALCGAVFPAIGQTMVIHRGPNTAANQADMNWQNAQLAAQAAQAAAAASQQALADARALFIPRDPWREINGLTNYARSAGWVQFCGRVTQVTEGGILVSGNFAEPLDDMIVWPQNYQPIDFFVKNFPHTVADGELLTAADAFTARTAATYSYTTVLGAMRTVRCLDYGRVCNAPPLTPEQRAAQKRAAEAAVAARNAAKQKTEASQARAVKANQEAADKGDAYGLLRMGERYRDGEGVEKDLAKARDYLKKAADAGSDTAQTELAALPK